MKTRTELEQLLIKRLQRTPHYREALEIVRKNTTGKLWLIGGIVSRSLLAELYRTPQEGFDIDFLVEEIRDPITIPQGWHVRRKSHGNPTLVHDNIEIDLFPIATHHFIASNGLKPTIESFLRGVPFTIQALVFDIEEQRLIGDVGMEAIFAREYRVNNLCEAKRMVDAKGITVNDRIKTKAQSLGLQPVYQKE